MPDAAFGLQSSMFVREGETGEVEKAIGVALHCEGGGDESPV